MHFLLIRAYHLLMDYDWSVDGLEWQVVVHASVGVTQSVPDLRHNNESK